MITVRVQNREEISLRIWAYALGITEDELVSRILHKELVSNSMGEIVDTYQATDTVQKSDNPQE